MTTNIRYFLPIASALNGFSAFNHSAQYSINVYLYSRPDAGSLNVFVCRSVRYVFNYE